MSGGTFCPRTTCPGGHLVRGDSWSSDTGTADPVPVPEHPVPVPEQTIQLGSRKWEVLRVALHLYRALKDVCIILVHHTVCFVVL